MPYPEASQDECCDVWWTGWKDVSQRLQVREADRHVACVACNHVTHPPTSPSWAVAPVSA